MANTLTPNQVMQVAAKAQVAIDTVKRWLATPDGVRPITAERCEKAMVELGFKRDKRR